MGLDMQSFCQSTEGEKHIADLFNQGDKAGGLNLLKICASPANTAPNAEAYQAERDTANDPADLMRRDDALEDKMIPENYERLFNGVKESQDAASKHLCTLDISGLDSVHPEKNNYDAAVKCK